MLPTRKGAKPDMFADIAQSLSIKGSALKCITLVRIMAVKMFVNENCWRQNILTIFRDKNVGNKNC